MARPKIIIEGSNLSGKTSVIGELEKKFVHSVVVTFHGYYHPEFLKVFNNKNKALNYHKERLKAFLPTFSKISTEELIFKRFHVTASVYLKLFYNLEENFFDIEDELNKLNVYLIVIDFDDQALEKRLKERQSKNKEAPWGDNDFSLVKEKRNLYQHFFQTSKIKNKFLIDNSNLTAEQAAQRIQEVTHS